MPMIRPLPCLVLAWAAALAHAQSSEPAPLQPMDVFQMQWADAPELSPDGKSIVYERSWFDVMKDRRRSNLWIIDSDGRDNRPLTTGAANDGGATWSPDGKRLAWVASEDGKAQIFVRWMDRAESAAITHLTQAPRHLSWSPDGKWIAFTMRVPAPDVSIAQMPAAPKGAEWAAPPRVIDRVIYRIDGSGYVDPGYTHVFVVAADGGAPRQITEGKHNFMGRPAWTRDDRALIVSSNFDPDWEYEPLESDLYRVDVASGAVARLTQRKGPDQGAVVSPDGKRIAWLGYDDNGKPYQGSHIYTMELAGGSPHVLTPDFDFDVDDLGWDGNSGLFFHYDDQGVTKIGWIAAGGGKVQTLADDFGGTGMGRPYSGGAMSTAAGRVAYTRNSAYRPADVAIVDRGGKPRSLTDLNANLLGHRKLAQVQAMHVKSSADGRDVEAWMMTPPDFDATRKYPLLLEIHGGPFANYGPRFAPETQLYAAHGYIVVYANPRGSTSYGSEFANLIQNAYPSKDYDDLISVVEAVIARGSVDTQQPVRHRRQRRRRADGVDRRPHRSLPGCGRRQAGDQLVQLHADVGSLSAVLALLVSRHAVATGGQLHGALADHVRRQREDADDADHRRGRSPHAELGSRAVLSGVEIAQGRYGAAAHSWCVARNQYAAEQHAGAGAVHDRLVRQAPRDPDE